MSSDDIYRTVMTVDPPAVETPFESSSREFLFNQVWNRPGLSIRDRRIVSLSCVAAADAVKPIDEHVYAALRSGDLTLEQMNEITLHFAVYCGWPKGSQLEMTVRSQWHRIHAERGEPAPLWPTSPLEDLGSTDHAERIRAGQEEFLTVNVVPASSDRLALLLRRNPRLRVRTRVAASGPEPTRPSAERPFLA